MKILVIEDSDADFRMVERALAGEFLISRSTSLASGLKLAISESVDLILLDLTLEDSSGFDTFRLARDKVPSLPILVLSGLNDNELALRCVSEGAQDYIPKSRLLDCSLNRFARYAIERERYQNAVAESERFARATVDSLTAHIAILDERGTIQAVNRAWSDFAEANCMSDPTGGVGQNYLKICEQASSDNDPVAHVVASGIRDILGGRRSECFVEYPCHSPTQNRWFMMKATPFKGPGPTRVVVAHEDITHRKLAEQLASEQCGLRDAVAGMEQVLGVVGHELRTPLAAVRAITEFLCTDGARNTQEADKFLLSISQEVDRMSDTVNNLLEAARLNSGRAKWNWAEVDLDCIIHEAIESINPLIDASRVRVITYLDGDAKMMAGDADAIRRVLINLLSNARKHTNDGEIAIVTRRIYERDISWVELTVRDSGCGISTAIVQRLGEAFALNAGVVGKNHVSGTGLGLAICKGIATAHGGCILVASEEGVGTTVTARLRQDLEAATSGDTVRSGEIQEALP